MKHRLPVTSWVSDTAFALNPHTDSESGLRRFSTACLEKHHSLKEAITEDLASRFAGALRPEIVRQAVNEADALAARTAFPILFLPTLAEEKVLLASQWHSKQRLLREGSGLVAA